MTRRTVAALVIGLWAIAMGWLAYRQTHKTQGERLADASLRVSPGAYYYNVYQDSAQVGIASSLLDTTHGSLWGVDYFRGRMVIAGDTQPVKVSAISYLTRRFIPDSFALSVTGIPHPISVHAAPKVKDALVFLPSIAPVPFMLMGDPTVGREAPAWIYNPITRGVQQITFRIQAESLFTVSDSARYDSTAMHWVSAHTDTIRAWSIAPKTSGLIVWVDRQGRTVSASDRSGLHMLRSNYEESFDNWRKLRP